MLINITVYFENGNLNNLPATKNKLIATNFFELAQEKADFECKMCQEKQAEKVFFYFTDYQDCLKMERFKESRVISPLFQSKIAE